MINGGLLNLMSTHQHSALSPTFRPRAIAIKANNGGRDKLYQAQPFYQVIQLGRGALLASLPLNGLLSLQV